jgi:cobalt/nickel transport system permease protein
VSGGHAHGLYVHARSPVHALRPECKVAAGLLFVIVGVATGREALWAFVLYAALLAGVTGLARVPARFLARRLTFEAPFVAFALLLPFLGRAPTVEAMGIALSIEGLWAAWNIISKATLGLWTTTLVAATTPATEILRGLERLRVPRVMTAIAGFMVRYGDLVTGEMRRMAIARAARAYEPRWLWQTRALAASTGTLFIRSFERGERVYVAMLSRGFSGRLPDPDTAPAPAVHWVAALALPAAGAAVAVTTRLLP